jgi:hypothetical protein
MTETSLAVLLAEREIRNVILRYCRGIDRGDRDVVRECYHPGAVDLHGRYRGDGREFADHALNVLAERYRATLHTVHNSLIDVEGDVAHAETYVVAYHFADTPTDDAHLYVFGGRYVDRFERRGTTWRIARRLLLRDWTARHPIDPPALEHEQREAAAFENGRRDRDDLSYHAALERWTVKTAGSVS